jgi:hypothetical protein
MAWSSVNAFFFRQITYFLIMKWYFVYVSFSYIINPILVYIVLFFSNTFSSFILRLKKKQDEKYVLILPRTETIQKADLQWKSNRKIFNVFAWISSLFTSQIKKNNFVLNYYLNFYKYLYIFLYWYFQKKKKKKH